MFDFNRVIERRDAHASKWDMMARLSGITAPDAIPMWVADMDFAAPPGVTEALAGETSLATHGYCVAATKTFNLAGAHVGACVTSNAALKRRLDARIAASGLASYNKFGMIGAEAAWRTGEAWLDALLPYLAAICSTRGSRPQHPARTRCERPVPEKSTHAR